MSRTPLPFATGDISTFAKNLRRQLEGCEETPSHLALLNMLVKASGYRNFQHFKSQQEARLRLESTEPSKGSEAEINYKRIRRIRRFFDKQKRLVRWPKKFSERMLCLWGIWAQIPARTEFTEKEISEFIEQRHLFGDYALIRRLLVDHGMMRRTPDGRSYQRQERQPPVDALVLIEQIVKS